MNDYEEIISPNELDAKKSFLDRIRIGVAKLARGSEEHPRRHLDGSKTYIDTHGRLVVERTIEEGMQSGEKSVSVDSNGNKTEEKVHNPATSKKVLREIYGGTTKASSPQIEEVNTTIERDFDSHQESGRREHREYFKSREEYEKYQEYLKQYPQSISAGGFVINNYIPKFGGGMPMATADITYDKDGGYSMHLLDNRNMTHPLSYQGLEISGYRELDVTYFKLKNGYRIDKDIKYLDGRRNGTNVIGNETIRQIKELGVTADERKYEDREGNKAEIKDIRGGMSAEYLFESRPNSKNLDIIRTKTRNAFGSSHTIYFDGRFEEVNGKVIQADGTQKLCFEREGDSVRRIPQPSIFDLRKECIKRYDEANGKVDKTGLVAEKRKKYDNLFKVEIAGYAKNTVRIIKQAVEGLGRYATDRKNLEDLEDVFEPIRKSCGFDSHHKYIMAGAHDGFESHFSGSGGFNGGEISDIEAMALKSKYEASHGATNVVNKNRDHSQKREERQSYTLEDNDER